MFWFFSSSTIFSRDHSGIGQVKREHISTFSCTKFYVVHDNIMVQSNMRPFRDYPKILRQEAFWFQKSSPIFYQYIFIRGKGCLVVSKWRVGVFDMPNPYRYRYFAKWRLPIFHENNALMIIWSILQKYRLMISQNKIACKLVTFPGCWAFLQPIFLL